ncbi:MAG: serine/threonine protein kinase [Phycisphaerae bacterium]|nr:serine/threonine protein kinase [Phycisphaerae bacterium]
MTPDAPSPRRAEDLFAEALATPPERRLAWLRDACGDDAVLYDDLSSLVAASERARTFLETPVADATTVDPSALAGRALIGATVGDFTLLDVLGEGGMGIVFRAEQRQPRRIVALKLVRPGLATPATLRRFELEAEALGRLRHPGIAAIHAAGTADVGAGPQPYFAMEFVEGLTLREYLATVGATIPERVRILALIADAVQHAHQNGVIHRDLKPENVVVETDAQGSRGAARPRILDFGVARVVEPGRAGEAPATVANDLVGTLQYMSPEQVDGGNVDTRSDVYALGLIAWEAFAGRPARVLRGASLAEAIRIVADTDPPSLASAEPTVPKDLGLVVDKALAREPERRYASAADFARDLERFLRHEPVTARAPTAAYLLARFARRRRALVGAVAAILVVAAVAIPAILVSLVHATRARDEARARAEESSALTEYLFDALGLNPNLEGSRLQKELPEFLTTLETNLAELDGKPEAQVRLLNNVGELFNVNTDYAESKRVFERSLDLCNSALPRDHELRASALHGLAAAEWFLGQRDRSRLETARRLNEEALELRRAILGEMHSDTALTMRHLAATYRSLGDNERAEALYRRSLEIHEALHAAGDPRADATMLASGHNGLATFLITVNDFDDAERELSKALHLMRSLPKRRIVDEGRVLRNRGRTLVHLGRYDDADQALRQAEELFRAQLGDRHREVATTIVRRGELEQKRGNAEAARALGEQAEREFDLAENDTLREEARKLGGGG